MGYGEIVVLNRSHYEDDDPQRYWNWTVSQILIETMEAMKLTYPNPHLDIRVVA